MVPWPWRMQGPAPLPAPTLHQQQTLDRSPARRCLNECQLYARPAGRPHPRAPSELCTLTLVLEAVRQGLA